MYVGGLFCHLVVLVLASLLGALGQSRSYKVKDSAEEDTTKSLFADPRLSFGSGLEYPDFFSHISTDGIFGDSLSFGPFLEARKGKQNLYPANTYGVNFGPIQSEGRSLPKTGGKAIPAEYNQWSLEEDDGPYSSNKRPNYSEEYEGESEEEPPRDSPYYRPHTGPYAPRSQYPKTSRPILRTNNGPAPGGATSFSSGIQINGHQFGVNQGPPLHRSSNNFLHQSRKDSNENSYSKFGEFKPSPPDHYRNAFDNPEFTFDFDFTHNVPQNAKIDSGTLDASCVENNRTVERPSKFQKTILFCFDCYDNTTKTSYEQCTEGLHQRYKRETNNTKENEKTERDKRQNEYKRYEPDYRFEVDHFSDSSPFEDDSDRFGEDGDRFEEPGGRFRDEGEKCVKKKKGEMMCISCENKGGTYERCKYSSEPQKKSYESSVSKTYGSPRSPEDRFSGERSDHYRPPVADRGYDRSDENRREYAAPYYEEPNLDPLVPPPPKYGGSKPVLRHSYRELNLPPQRVGPRPPANRPDNHPENRNVLNLHSRPSPGVLSKTNRDPNRPTNRIFVIPSVHAPEPIHYGIPDPYSPDVVTLDLGYDDDDDDDVSYVDDDDSAPVKTFGFRMRKPHSNLDYDIPFPSGFPELSGADPISLAPPVDYDDSYSDFNLADRRNSHNPKPASDRRQTNSTNTEIRNVDPATRNRPNRAMCKTVKRNRMTCLQCVESNGIRHEECTNVGEPKSKQYELDDIRFEPQETKHNSTEVQYSRMDVGSAERGKRKFKKYSEPITHHKFGDKTPEYRGQGQHVNQQNSTYSNQERSGSKKRRDAATGPNNPVPTAPTKAERSDHSSKTKLIYHPGLKIPLPKYMLERTEHEVIFDEVVPSG